MIILLIYSRSTILVKLKPQNHVLYQPGDHIAIYPQNHPNIVKELLERLNLPFKIDEPIIVESKITNQDGKKYNFKFCNVKCNIY